MTITEQEALEAMLAHHRRLGDELAGRVRTLRAAVYSGNGHEPAVAGLVAFVADEVLPHAVAEEHTVYRAAGARGELSEALAGMVDEHRRLAASLERLAAAVDGSGAMAEADALRALFAGHVVKENELVLPTLAADETVDLAALLVQMHRLTEAARDDTPVGQDLMTPDTEARLLALLLEGARHLADVGQGEAACRVAAQAWAALQVPRPDLAVRVTAALHRLARSATVPAPAPTTGPPAAGSVTDPSLDVRTLAPAQRHEKIFATYGALAAGLGVVLVNDHDPKPLRYQFEAEHPGAFTWDVLEAGPTVWRVRIGRPATGGDAGDELEVDVRHLPHGQRHGVIFSTFDALGPGAGFVLVNDHDPQPLHYQFEAQHESGFTWDYLETGPAVWRVRIGRAAGARR